MDKPAASADDRFAVFVVYQLRKEAGSTFLRLATAHAARTLREDRDCLQYDVIVSDGDRILFYEVYTSAAAHLRHLQSGHLADFRQARAPYVTSLHEYSGTMATTVEPEPCPTR
jgi:quinol monooxygenase YgiN